MIFDAWFIQELMKMENWCMAACTETFGPMLPRRPIWSIRITLLKIILESPLDLTHLERFFMITWRVWITEKLKQEGILSCLYHNRKTSTVWSGEEHSVQKGCQVCGIQWCFQNFQGCCEGSCCQYHDNWIGIWLCHQLHWPFLSALSPWHWGWV